MDKLPIGYIKGKGNPLDKKVPKSKKYDHIKGTLSTGPTIRDIEVISNATIAKKRNEIFKRIKVSTLSNLLKQDNQEESIYNLQGQQEDSVSQFDNKSQFDTKSQYSQQSRLTEVSQVSAITYATEQLGINDNTSFLLLDLREPEDFEMFNIRESINYPAPQLSRDKVIPALLRFKNQPDKLIIIYHFDEKHGIPTATLFAEKGYENVFLLSGGIEKFLMNFPEQVQGKKVPVMVKPEMTQQTKILKRSNYKETDEPIKSENKSETKSRISDQKSQITQQRRTSQSKKQN